ncbi:hypothetical protein NDU88_008611 [Pleurodeles waltl]|uniref:Uncharacterized protein n=1 Tax=Pleurodeles waltl TaxID=8319 RepID=A0AAV7RSW2_PLEWA|nr:hypothetical protein NDU88_008611 [Pleurodeles waltl]
MADFSRETNERRKEFMALRSRMSQLEVKYGLFEPARLRATKNGVSKNFYVPEDLRIYLDSLQSQSIDTTDSGRPLRPSCDIQDTMSPTFSQEGPGCIEPNHQPRGRDLDRLAKTHDLRGQILQEVALHSQLSDSQILPPTEAHIGPYLKLNLLETTCTYLYSQS